MAATPHCSSINVEPCFTLWEESAFGHSTWFHIGLPEWKIIVTLAPFFKGLKTLYLHVWGDILQVYRDTPVTQHLDRWQCVCFCESITRWLCYGERKLLYFNILYAWEREKLPWISEFSVSLNLKPNFPTVSWSMCGRRMTHQTLRREMTCWKPWCRTCN